jgi:hypothetical protein
MAEAGDTEALLAHLLQRDLVIAGNAHTDAHALALAPRAV